MFVGDNGPWHMCLVEEVAPAFEKETGIKIDFTNDAKIFGAVPAGGVTTAALGATGIRAFLGAAF